MNFYGRFTGKHLSLSPLLTVMIMEWLLVVMLVLVGAVLVLMEFLVFPGINVAGVLGLGCVIAGVYFGYAFYGAVTGHLILLGTALFGFGLTGYVLRSDTWKKLKLHTALDGAVEGVAASVKVGDEGIALGRLAPMGNVRLGEEIVEAESQSGYIDAHREVTVVKILKNKVIVKLKTV